MIDEYRHWGGPIAPPPDDALADIRAVEQLAKVYALGIDMRDLDLVLSCFEESGIGEGTAGRAPLHDYLRRTYAGAAAYRATQHTMVNQYVCVDGDEALMWTYGVAFHIAGEGMARGNLTVGVHYRDLCRRRPEGWLIHRRKAVVQWADGPLPGAPA